MSTLHLIRELGAFQKLGERENPSTGIRAIDDPQIVFLPVRIQGSRLETGELAAIAVALAEEVPDTPSATAGAQGGSIWHSEARSRAVSQRTTRRSPLPRRGK